MKTVLMLTILFMTIALFAVTSFGQTGTAPSIDKNSQWNVFSVVPAKAITATDTVVSGYFIPTDVCRVIFWLEADTISASDTLITIVQGSPDLIAWKTLATFATMTAVGVDRQTSTLTDRYLRVIDTVTGTTIRHYRKVKAIPKLY
jgi:hypothetical protein